MRTRVISSLIVAATAATLAGCGGSDAGETQPETTAASTIETTTAGVSTGQSETETTTSAPPPRLVRIRVIGGSPQGGIARPTIAQGRKVLLVVASDTADEIHVHGYDVSAPVAAGGTARLSFVAKIPGRFEVELEESGVRVAQLTVR